jgi:hypothetical protein
MAGQITGISTLSGTTGLFGTISTTNNTNVGLPSVGVAGNTGDKLILAAGTNNPSGTYPYSLGINTNSLWYSVPSGASHNFYNNGTNTLTIDSTGNVGIGTAPDVTYRLNVSDYVKLKYLYIFNPDGRITHLPFGGNNQNYIRGKLNIDGTRNGLAVAGPTTLSGATTVTGNLTVNSILKLKNNDWHTTIDGVNRLYYSQNEISYYCCGGNSASGHVFMNNTFGTILTLKNNNDVSCTGNVTASGNITATGNVYAANFGIGIPLTPNCRLDVQGAISRAGGTPGWLWNLRPGSLDWISHPDISPDGSSISR